MQRTEASLIQVSLEESAPIPAWSFGDLWNGFAVPWFDATQLDAALSTLTEGRFLSRRTESGAESFDDCADPPRWIPWEQTEISTTEGSKRVWSFGGLCWFESEEDEPFRCRSCGQTTCPDWCSGC